DQEPHTVPNDEIVGLVRELLAGAPAGVSLDALANALRERGFSRPPGSPRLITRLRRIKELDVSRSGTIRLVDNGADLSVPGGAAVAHDAARSVVEPSGVAQGGEGERGPGGGAAPGEPGGPAPPDRAPQAAPRRTSPAGSSQQRRGVGGSVARNRLTAPGRHGSRHAEALPALGGDHLRVPGRIPDDVDVRIADARKREQLVACVGSDR